jgi:hypothetical protein
MEVSGQLHALTALPPGKEPQSRFGQGGEEKNFQPPPGNRTPDHPARSPALFHSANVIVILMPRNCVLLEKMTDSSSPSQKFLHLFMKYLNSLHTLTPYFLKLHFNNILPSMPVFPKKSLPVRCQPKMYYFFILYIRAICLAISFSLI